MCYSQTVLPIGDDAELFIPKCIIARDGKNESRLFYFSLFLFIQNQMRGIHVHLLGPNVIFKQHSIPTLSGGFERKVKLLPNAFRKT